ncbi:MAG: hypothetical protein GY832_37305 [Chloroflexi bacterium]|nr:hypothetical protein [Chloroflexota bacterium]
MLGIAPQGQHQSPRQDSVLSVVDCVNPYLWGYKSAKSAVAAWLENRPTLGYWEVCVYHVRA